MKIGVISDTHLHSVSSNFAHLYQKYLVDTDILIHCGDYVGEEIVYFLSNHKHFVGVKGNCDFFSLDLPLRIEFEIGKWRLGIIHGFGYKNLHLQPEQLHLAFEQVDIICFGHTHKKTFLKIGDVYFLNPGTCQSSLALLDLSSSEPQVQFIDF
ncbi:MAG: YfcE family phosphodiesterase [Desulfonauticus sp.]|nr:YfcE family phosphodiesterase [Desulfonauticus sp.]